MLICPCSCWNVAPNTNCVQGKADDLYRGSMQSEDHRRTALQYPLVHWTLCRCQQYGAFSTKAIARYQIILLGKQRHIRCEQLAQGCCANNAAVGVNPRPPNEFSVLPLHHRATCVTATYLILQHEIILWPHLVMCKTQSFGHSFGVDRQLFLMTMPSNVEIAGLWRTYTKT